MTARSTAHLHALVNERQSNVRQKLGDLLNALAANIQGEVQAANNALSKALHALAAVVAQQDWPEWLREVMAHVDNYKNNHANGPATWRAHLHTLIKYYREAEGYVWFSGDETVEFDVDAIIDEVKSELEIDAIFAKMVAALEALAACEELDSVKACADLERLIQILRRSRGGSFTSQVVSWRFARRFVSNVISCYLKESKITGPLIKAFEQTADELDVALDEAKDRIGQKVIEAATTGFRSDALKSITAQDIKALPDLRSEPPKGD